MASILNIGKDGLLQSPKYNDTRLNYLSIFSRDDYKQAVGLLQEELFNKDYMQEITMFGEKCNQLALGSQTIETEPAMLWGAICACKHTAQLREMLPFWGDKETPDAAETILQFAMVNQTDAGAKGVQYLLQFFNQKYPQKESVVTLLGKVFLFFISTNQIILAGKIYDATPQPFSDVVFHSAQTHLELCKLQESDSSKKVAYTAISDTFSQHMESNKSIWYVRAMCDEPIPADKLKQFAEEIANAKVEKDDIDFIMQMNTDDICPWKTSTYVLQRAALMGSLKTYDFMMSHGAKVDEFTRLALELSSRSEFLDDERKKQIKARIPAVSSINLEGIDTFLAALDKRDNVEEPLDESIEEEDEEAPPVSSKRRVPEEVSSFPPSRSTPTGAFARGF
jgi:hypothetical protein